MTTYKEVKQSNLVMKRKARSLEGSMACSHIHRYFAFGKITGTGAHQFMKRPVSCRPCILRAVQQGRNWLGINRTLQCLFSANICRMPTMPRVRWLRASPPAVGMFVCESQLWASLGWKRQGIQCSGAQASTCPEESAESLILSAIQE